MDNLIWNLRWTVFDHIKNYQTVPTLKQISNSLALSDDQAEQALLLLSKDHLALAYDQNSKSITMAWPFSATPTAYPVDTPKGRYWANCAWDALSIPSLLETDARSLYQCPNSQEEILIQIEHGKLFSTEAVVHFSIPPKVFYEDLGCI